MEPPGTIPRLAGMLTRPTVSRSSLRALALALPLTLIVAACGAAAAPTPSPASPTARPTPTAVPGDGATAEPDGNAGGGNTGGGQPGDPGTGGGIDFPLPPVPGDDPLLGDATAIVPKPGTLDPHAVNVQLVRAMAADGHVLVEARWWSGVEDCYPTDSVQVDIDEDAKTVALTVLEGTAGGDVMCIEIAMLKATAVDLGPLAAGTWTISAEGDASSIKLEVG